jgi:hypothetical protein
MAKKSTYNRRDFLKALGSSALYLPVLPSFFPVQSFAQASTAPKRVIFIVNRNAPFASGYYPANGGTQVQTNIFQAPLNAISGSISSIFNTEYDTLKNKVSIIRGLDVVGSHHDHNRTSFLCSVTQPAKDLEYADTPIGASADWIMEQSPNFYTSIPRKRALRFANGGDRGVSFSNIGGAIEGLAYSDEDSSFFNYAFAGVTGSGTPATVDPIARKSFLIDQALTRLNFCEQIHECRRPILKGSRITSTTFPT